MASLREILFEQTSRSTNRFAGKKVALCIDSTGEMIDIVVTARGVRMPETVPENAVSIKNKLVDDMLLERTVMGVDFDDDRVIIHLM